MAEQLMRVKEVAEYLQVCTKTIYNWIRAGKLDAVRLPNGKIRLNEEQVDELIKKGNK